MCSRPDSTEQALVGRLARFFQNRRRRFGGMLQPRPLPPVAPPTPPFPRPVFDRPLRPLTRPVNAPLTAIKNLPVPLRHNWSRQEVEDLLPGNPCGVALAAQQVHRGPPIWLSSPAGFPC